MNSRDLARLERSTDPVLASEAQRCAKEDGEGDAVEREGDRLYHLLMEAVGGESIIADERQKRKEKAS